MEKWDHMCTCPQRPVSGNLSEKDLHNFHLDCNLTSTLGGERAGEVFEGFVHAWDIFAEYVDMISYPQPIEA